MNKPFLLLVLGLWLGGSVGVYFFLEAGLGVSVVLGLIVAVIAANFFIPLDKCTGGPV